jgi:hypothetical protein
MAFWKSETASGGSTKQKKFKQSGGAHKSESQTPQSKIKNAGTNRFFKINNNTFPT